MLELKHTGDQIDAVAFFNNLRGVSIYMSFIQLCFPKTYFFSRNCEPEREQASSLHLTNPAANVRFPARSCTPPVNASQP